MITFTEVTWYSKLAAVIFFIGVLPVLTFYIGMKYQEVISITSFTPIITSERVKVPTDFKNATYIIDGTTVTLHNGVSEVAVVEGSESKVITQYFGNEVYSDLNNDGKDDVTFVITQSSGGSGTFFYVVAALTTEHGYIGSKALFFGDRIAPQSTVKGERDTVIVNYADRKSDEGFAIAPSVGKSLMVRFDSSAMEFKVVVQKPVSSTEKLAKVVYSYECDEHVRFQFSANDTLSTLYLKPIGTASYPPVSTLVQKETSSGVRYEGNGIVLTGKGESLTLNEGGSTLNCSPVSVPNEAPLNFGD